MRTLRALMAALVVASIAVVVPQGTAGAEGTETLGPASIPLATGSDIASAGVGMVDQPAALSIGVPPGATVEQVLLYWEGESVEPQPGDPTINVNGTEVVGNTIGGPTYFFTRSGRRVQTTSFRADITGMNVVAPGPNTLTLSGLEFSETNSGAGVIVIYDDGSGVATIDVRDGIDNAFRDFPEPRRSTVPQDYTFPAAAFERTADLALFVGSVAENRPNAIDVTVGGVTTRFTNLLGSNEGDEWDALHLPIIVPAGVTTAAVQILSVDDGTGRRPASLEWVTSALSVPPAGLPCSTDSSAATADGRAFGLSASLLGGTVKQEPVPDTDKQNPDSLASIKIGTSVASVQDELLTVVNERSLTDSHARDVATATSNNLAVKLPGLTVSASTVVARSASTASGTTAGSSRDGSKVQDLVINGITYGDVSEPVTIDVRDPLTNALVAQVRVLETTGTGAAGAVPQPEGVTATSAGVFKSGMTVNAVHVIAYDLAATLLVNENSDLIVGHARSWATFPSMLECETLPQVRGSAFLASVGNVDPDVGSVVAGQVNLPITGGEDEANAADTTPLGLVTGQTRTEGTLSPLQAHSRATAEDADLLGGLIRATVVESTSTTAGGSSTGTATIADLQLAGIDVCSALGLEAICSPAPNTVVPLFGSTLMVLNEQVPEAGGLTVNAVHIYIIGAGNPFGLPAGAEVILSSSTSGTSPAPPAP